MTTIRVLRTAKATLTRTFYLDEEVEGASGSVVVTIRRLDGSLIQTGNATPDGGGYSFLFDGRDVVDELTVSWAATVGGDAIELDQDVIEVVGGFYFSLAEGRDTDPVLANVDKFPTADLIARRIETETECERITEQAWVPRFRRVALSGSGRSVLVCPDPMIRTVRAVTMDGSVFSPDALDGVGFSDTGLIFINSGWRIPSVRGARNVVVEYEHGHDRPPPDIVRAARTRFKSLCLEGRSNLPDRAERQVTVDANGGTVIYGSPNAEKTGIPAVDAVYGRIPSPRPGFG